MGGACVRTALVAVSLLPLAACGGASTHARASRPAQREPYGEWNLGIAYGTSPAQVLRRLGAPLARRGGCWLYRGRAGRIRGRFSGDYVDAMKFCFAPGPLGTQVVTQILSHYAAHTIVRRDASGAVVARRSYAAEWGHPIVLVKVPDWYLEQGS